MKPIEGENTCPICKKKNLKEYITEHKIPYVGKILIFTVNCEKCGFKKSEIVPAEKKTPFRYSLKIEDPDDLKFKVLRGQTGFIKIPEYGLTMEPGIAAQSFITNIEGVLYRFLDAVEMLKNWTEVEEKKQRCSEIIRFINDAINGKTPFTIIVEDPLGVSCIFHESKKKMKKVRKEKLTDEEIKNLLDFIKVV